MASGGPVKVFLDYTQEELDRAYDQFRWADNAAAVIRRYAQDSARVRKATPPRTEAYGKSSAEILDVFAPPAARNAPVFVFFHGGAWRTLSKDDASAAAGPFVENGCIYVAVNFSNIPEVRLPAMVEQCRSAVLWLVRNLERLGGNPGEITLGGHSSGAHLCSVVLATDWSRYQQPFGFLKGGVLLSGMYDLHPVVLSSRREYLELSEAEVAALSPARFPSATPCPVLVAWGEAESPEFERQSREYAIALERQGRLHGQVVLETMNHFEIVEQLYSDRTPLMQRILGMMLGGHVGRTCGRPGEVQG